VVKGEEARMLMSKRVNRGVKRAKSVEERMDQLVEAIDDKIKTLGHRLHHKYNPMDVKRSRIFRGKIAHRKLSDEERATMDKELAIVKKEIKYLKKIKSKIEKYKDKLIDITLAERSVGLQAKRMFD
jgi:hypothetical protein